MRHGTSGKFTERDPECGPSARGSGDGFHVARTVRGVDRPRPRKAPPEFCAGAWRPRKSILHATRGIGTRLEDVFRFVFLDSSNLVFSLNN